MLPVYQRNFHKSVFQTLLPRCSKQKDCETESFVAHSFELLKIITTTFYFAGLYMLTFQHYRVTDQRHCKTGKCAWWRLDVGVCHERVPTRPARHLRLTLTLLCENTWVLPSW